MIETLVVIALSALALSGFLFALHFSGYKRKTGSGGCCGGLHCDSGLEPKSASCRTDETMNSIDEIRRQAARD